MAKIIKPSLNSSSVSFKPKVYNYQGQMAQAQTKHDTTSKSMIFDDYNYKKDISPAYQQTAAAVSDSFVSRIFNFIKKDIPAKLNDVVSEIKGKIESIFSKFKVDYSPSSDSSSRSSSENTQTTSGEKPPTPKEQPKPDSSSGNGNGGDPKPQNDKQKEAPKEPSKDEPKKEEAPKEEPKKEEPKRESSTPITKPGQNADLNQELNNKKGNVRIGNGVDNSVRTDCKTYSVGGDTNTNHTASDGTLSAKERELLIYLAYHEAGGDSAQATAVMSSYLNGWEKSGYSFNKYMAEACSRWSSGDDFAAATQSYRDGTYTYDDVVSLNKYKEMKNTGSYDALNACVDNVLAGTRNVNSTQWYGNGMYNTYTHPIN